MNVTFTEKHGATWAQRLGALCLLGLGLGGAWLWTELRAPECAASMQLLTADDDGAMRETEDLLAACLSGARAEIMMGELADDATPHNWKQKYFQRHPPADAAAWKKTLEGRILATRVRPRVLEINAGYAAFGTPQAANALRILQREMTAEHAARAEKIVNGQRAARDAAAARLDEELQLLQSETPSDARTAARKTLAGLRAAVEKAHDPAGGWQAPWAGRPELNARTADVEKALRDWQAARLQQAQCAARAEELAAWIDAPQNQTVKQIVKRVVHYEDTPEMIRLKDRKAEVEAARTRLLLRATPLHPTVKKMSAEIAELQAQINALARLPQTVEDVEERTNPQLTVWKRELVTARAAERNARTALDAAARAARASIDALEKADNGETAFARQKARAKLEKEREALAAQTFAPPPAPFSLYAAPAITRDGRGRMWPAYAIGAALGLLAGLALICGRKETDFRYSEPPAPAPEYPVLGVVPNFNESGK